MSSLTRTIESIALAPRDARQAISEKENKAIQLLRLVELRHIRAGQMEEAEQFRSIIDGLVAAWRRG